MQSKTTADSDTLKATNYCFEGCYGADLGGVTVLPPFILSGGRQHVAIISAILLEIGWPSTVLPSNQAVSFFLTGAGLSAAMLKCFTASSIRAMNGGTYSGIVTTAGASRSGALDLSATRTNTGSLARVYRTDAVEVRSRHQPLSSTVLCGLRSPKLLRYFIDLAATVADANAFSSPAASRSRAASLPIA